MTTTIFLPCLTFRSHTGTVFRFHHAQYSYYNCLLGGYSSSWRKGLLVVVVVVVVMVVVVVVAGLVLVLVAGVAVVLLLAQC